MRYALLLHSPDPAPGEISDEAISVVDGSWTGTGTTAADRAGA